MKKLSRLHFYQKYWILFSVLFIALTCSVHTEAASYNKLSFTSGYTSDLVLKKNASKTLRVTLNRKSASASRFKWSSNKKSVVSVSKSGKIRARKAGTAVITVKLKKGKGNTLRLKVRVYSKTKRTSFVQGSRLALKTGCGMQVTLPVKGSNTTYRSSNSKVFTVSSNGYIVGKKAGTATLTATTISGSTKYTVTSSVTIGDEVSYISINSTNRNLLTVYVGEQTSIQAVVSPSTALDKTLIYSSSDPAIAEIDRNGFVRGKSTGTVTLTVQSASNPSVKRTVKTYIVSARSGSFRTSTTFLLAAHRGLLTSAPENTIPAFDAAAKAGFKSVELDIWLSQDKQFIVVHDKNLEKMCGVKKNISSMTLEEIKSYPVTGGTNASQYPDNRIATLEEVIEFCNQKNLIPRIELKFNPNKDPAVLDHLMYVINSSIQKPIVISFYEKYLIPIRINYPNLKMCLLNRNPTAVTLQICKDYHFSLGTDYTNLTPDYIDQLHRDGIAINAWTVNTTATAHQLYRWGVDSITTNYKL